MTSFHQDLMTRINIQVTNLMCICPEIIKSCRSCTFLIPRIYLACKDKSKIKARELFLGAMK